MRRSGFTFVEILIVMIIIGLIAALGVPRIRDAVLKQNVRSARAAIGIMVAKARAAAVERGCPAVLQVRSPGRVWVTACRTRTVGATTALDTLGGIMDLGARYNVTITGGKDSIRFDPRGISMETSSTVVHIVSSSLQDSVLINQLGKVVR